jgi:hypothetical protein
MSKQTDLINIPDAITVSGSNVGIGTTSPAVALEIIGTTTSGIKIKTNSAHSNGFNLYWDSSVDNVVFNNPFSGAMLFETANTERMRIDSSGNVGIGTSSIASGGAGTTNLNLHTPSATSVYLKLSNASTGNTASDGFDLSQDASGNAYIINRENGFLNFWTNTTERMRIDSSGNVLVGKSSSSGYTTGIELRPYGLLTASRDSAAAVLVNRTTTEGAIISLAKDGAAVGSIGNNTDFYIASQDGCGLRFTNNQVLPCSESGATQTTSRDLGSSGARFRDLYTSGGVYLGGTGAANKLDDYEEGSWTPSMSGMGNASFSQQFGSYTKIGNLAHVTGKIAWSGATGTASVNITGIPFTGADASDHLLRNSAWPQGDYVNINTLIDRNGHFRIDTNVLFGVIDNTSGSTIAMQCGTHVASSGEFNFYLVYRTT